MRTADPEAIVGAYVDAFNAESLEALVATLSADIEIASRRGPVVGRDAARRWARRHVSGGLRQRLVLDGVQARGTDAVAFLRRQWLWIEDGEVADEEELAVVVSLDADGLIIRWHPFDDRSKALAAAGLDG
jgi:hypothetical protein